MNIEEMLFGLGNAVLLVGTLPLMFRAWKDRDTLHGFSLVGSLFTAVGCSLFFGIYLWLNWKLNVALTVPEIAFWWFVSYYTVTKEKEL